MVDSLDRSAGPGDTCLEVKVQDCCIDPKEFKEKVNRLIARDIANPPAYGNFCGDNCISWRNGIIREAAEFVKDDASWWCHLPGGRFYRP